MKKTILIIVLAALCPFFKLSAQNNSTIRGRVTDSVTHQPLKGATVSILSSKQSTSTDENGNFSINSKYKEGTLIISFVGYTTIQIRFSENNSRPFNISLSQDRSALKEVSIISTGYQTIPKERATGSFAQINNELFNRRTSTNVIDRLEGVVPGLIFNHNTAASSSGADISIRGHSTLFANDQPLVVLDNFPYDGDISNINPNDIENVTVLKDAAASSIWGVKSGNGVIVITTKRGKKNAALSVEANSNLTVSEKPDVFYNRNFLDANDFINVEKNLFAQGYYANDLSSNAHPVVSPVVALLASDLPQSEKDSRIDALRNIDYRTQLEKYFYRQAVAQQYNVNVRGGSVNTDYFLSAGYDNDLNSQIGNGSQRTTLNSMFNFSPVRNLDVSLGLNFVQSKGETNSPLGNLTGSKALYPYAQFAGVNGNALPIAKDYASDYTDVATQNGLLDWTYRPLDELHNADNSYTSTDNRVNFGLKYQPVPGLSFDTKYQYEKNTLLTESYNSLATYAARNLINQFTNVTPGSAVTYPIPIGGFDDRQSQYITSQRLRGQTSYQKGWSENEVNAIAGAEISDITTNIDRNRVYGFDKNTGAFTAVDMANFYQTNPSGYSSKIPTIQKFDKLSDRYISYYANAGYTYKKRYGLSLSGRIDKSNLFGVNTNQRAVPLYSVGGSWRLSDEKFYHLSWLPYARLRLTYGLNGNVDKNVAAVTTIQQQLNSYINGSPYATIANPGNPELRWEKIAMVNLALDFSTINNVISGSLEYYRKRGIDLFGDSPLPPSTGFPSFRGNTANTIGQGVDLVINTINVKNDSFNWTSTFNLSYTMDKVTKYDAPQTAGNALVYGTGNNGVILPLVGKPLFGVYSYRWAGLDPANGNPRGYLNGKVSEDYAAIMSNTPLDGLVFSGTSRPKYFGSFRNTVTYEAFSLSANILYKLDYFFIRPSINYSSLYQQWQGNSDYLKRWQKPGDELGTNVPSVAKLPLDGSRDAFYTTSSTLVSPGDHVRLQDISLSYDLSDRLAKKSVFKRLQLYCYINNVGIVWRKNKNGLDPDLYASGIPAPRSISFGIKTQLQ